MDYFQIGEASLRPVSDRCIISCSGQMAEKELFLSSHALLASILGRRPVVSPEMLVEALRCHCGITRDSVRVEVYRPFDFIITFARAEDCSWVLLGFSRQLFFFGSSVSFRRWHRTSAVDLSSMWYLTKLGLDGLLAHAWGSDVVGQIINSLGCHLVETLPVSDARCLKVLVWAFSPNDLHKELVLVIPEQMQEAELHMENYESDDSVSSQPPPPTAKSCLEYKMFIHIIEVLDPAPSNPFARPDDEDDISPRRNFFFYCIGHLGAGDMVGSHAFGGPQHGSAGGLGHHHTDSAPPVVSLFEPLSPSEVPDSLAVFGSPREELHSAEGLPSLAPLPVTRGDVSSTLRDRALASGSLSVLALTVTSLSPKVTLR
ncbi:hypothetical protein ABZP36_034909 [Zizania latifolia]